MNSENRDEQLVVVATYGWLGEAELARSSLEAHGILAFVADEHIASANWLDAGAFGGIKVMVRESDLTIAKETLDALSQDVVPDDPSQEIIGFPDPICPKCGSQSTRFERVHRKVGLLSILLLGLPIFFAENKWCCKDCNHTWLPSNDGP